MTKGRWIFAGAVVVAFVAGGVVASRTDPFPPGVGPTTSPTTEPPEPATWAFTLTSGTRHDLHVGGTCATDWRLRTTIAEGGGGTFAARAAKPRGYRRCAVA